MKKRNNDEAVNKWLAENGISPYTFEQIEPHLLQAQRIAHNTLKHHTNLLGQNEAATLNNFLHSMSSRKAAKITITQAFKVMNIGAAVNRKLFKQHRQLKRLT
jgi:hypothetical protein